MTDSTAMKKDYLPGVGKYNIEKADRFLTLGANKSYKWNKFSYEVNIIIAF